MKICIITNHFYPEDFKINDIAFELAVKENEITVLTAIPDYPYGKYYDGYSLFKKNREVINGVNIVRIPRIPRGKGNKIKLGLNYFSYLVSLSFYIRFHSIKKDYDAVLVHMTSPFFLGLPAVWLKKKKSIPLIFWVLDLWPESVVSAGNIKSKAILYPLEKMVQKVYSHCDRILVGSKGFKKSICEKGNFESKIEYFPNWAEDIKPIKNFSKEPFPKNDNDFIFMFAGNIGEAQNLDCLLTAAMKFKDRQNIKFVFLGDGRKKRHLQEMVVSLRLEETCFFPGRFPLEAMPELMSIADVLVVSLKDEKIFNMTVPAKVQFYMSQGKPVLAMLNGDGADLIKDADCGIAVPAGNIKETERGINSFLKMNKDELKIKGINGKRYYERVFRKELRIEQMENVLKNIQGVSTK